MKGYELENLKIIVVELLLKNKELDLTLGATCLEKSSLSDQLRKVNQLLHDARVENKRLVYELNEYTSESEINTSEKLPYCTLPYPENLKEEIERMAMELHKATEYIEKVEENEKKAIEQVKKLTAENRELKEYNSFLEGNEN